ncbi:hypothetical protein [Umezawaea sp. Da 62-37]|uniref:hypothetical protein n=1 Tax=Umezawaea sp. Da 62-37 TaxID=3075927 RepID=UPI0028F723BC|nr:hypothetical protein [Umezawaea sp. Da 62-37]WNV85609.1 hypothetical protein RM788_47085 [Umezawaea sp. Da 62-37]
MRRAWGLSAALTAASTYACVYAAALLPLRIWTWAPAARSDVSAPALVYLHPLVQFVDLVAGEAYFEQLHGWEWLPRLVLAVALVAAVHLATRAVAVGRVRVAVAQVGAVLLAAGIADLVTLAVVVARADGEVGVAVALAQTRVFWAYDALFFGFLCSAVVVLGFFLQRLLWAFAGRPVEALADLPEPEHDDGPRGTADLALACSLPIVALALLGGAFAYSGRSEQQIRLVDEAAELALHPRLQLRPQVDLDAGFGEVVGAERWVPGSVSAVLSLVVLWSLLRWVLAGVRPTAGGGAVVVAVWGSVVVAGALAAGVDVVAFPSLPADVPHAIRFGVLWGWLPAVIALVGLRRRR